MSIETTSTPQRQKRQPGLSVEVIHRNLRRMVLEFDLRPGEALNERRLGELLGVGRTPLREALNRVVADGLVEHRIGKGFHVRDLDPDEIVKLFELRLVLECASVRLATERASDAELLALRRDWQAVMDRMTEAEPDDLLHQDAQFHEAVARLGRNEPMARVIADVNERIYLVRWAAMHADMRRQTFVDHDRIVGAMLDRDAARAEALMRTHISTRIQALHGAIADGLLRSIEKSAAELKHQATSQGDTDDTGPNCTG